MELMNAKVRRSWLFVSTKSQLWTYVCKATKRRDWNHERKMSDGDKVLQQRGALFTNGHFRVLSASNMATKSNRYLCHSFARKKLKVLDLQHTKIERIAGLAFRHYFLFFFALIPVTQRSKRSLKPAPRSNEKLWTSMNFHVKFWIFAWKADFHLRHPSERWFLFSSINGLEVWLHLKKSQISFQKLSVTLPRPPQMLYSIWRSCYFVNLLGLRVWMVGGSRCSVVHLEKGGKSC